MILKEEFLKKYINNKTYSDFIKDYFKIYNIQTNDYISFELFEQQKSLLEKITEEQFTVCKKSRQVGATQTVLIWMLCNALFAEDGETFVYVGVNNDCANEASYRIMSFIKQLPLGIFANNMSEPLLKKFNKNEIVFFNNTKILFKNFNNIQQQMCGIANIKTFVFDEFAFIKDNKTALRILYSILPCSTQNSKIVIISTPNGKNNLFYYLYKENPSFSMEWFNDPRYNNDIIWIRNNDILIRLNKDYKGLLEDGWKPSSPWYIKMCNAFNDKNKSIQEIDGKFI